MLAADAELDVGARLAPALDGQLHEAADALLIEAGEDVAAHDFEVAVEAEEAAGVIAAHAEAGLREVVGAEAEEFGDFRDLIGGDAGAGHFDHGADLVADAAPALVEDLGGDAVDDGLLQLELLAEGDEGHHDLGLGLDAALLLDFDGGLEDGARLHFGDFGVGDAEAAAAVPEHGVELVQLQHAPHDHLDGDVEFLREVELLLLGLRQELVQGRVEQADGGRAPLEHLEHALEVALLEGQQLCDGLAAVFDALGEDEAAHVVDAVAVEEHVLGAAEADARRAEGDGRRGLIRRVGIRAHLQALQPTTPLHDLREVAVRLALLGLHRAVQQHLDDFRGHGRQLAFVDEARGAVQREVVALAVSLAAQCNAASDVVNLHLRDTADADLAHLARDEGRVAREASARRQDALGGHHAAQIFGRGLQAHEQHLLALLVGLDAARGVEVDAARGGAGAGVEAHGDAARGALGVLVEDRREHLVHLIGRDAAHGRLPVDEALALQIAGDAEGGEAGALAVARLQHVDLAVLNGELEVLHVAEVLLERLADAAELLKGLGHHLGELRHGLGRAHAGYHVLALSIDEELAVELVAAQRRVAREGHAGARALRGVAEDHALHVHGRAPLAGDAVLLSVGDGALVLPGAEDGADGAPELLARLGGEGAARAREHQRAEALHELAVVLGRQLRVRHIGAVALRLEAVNLLLEGLQILAGRLLYPHDDVAVHLHEAAVAVPGEARVVRRLGEGLHRLIVEAEVENRIHHAGHRLARAGAHRDEKRHRRRIAEAAADERLHARQPLLHHRLQLRRVAPLVVVVIGADLRRDRESRGHRQADARHLRQVGALAAQLLLHASVAVGRAAAKVIDELFHGCVLE